MLKVAQREQTYSTDLALSCKVAVREIVLWTMKHSWTSKSFDQKRKKKEKIRELENHKQCLTFLREFLKTQQLL